MNWQEVCDDPALQDLPFKIELKRALYFEAGATEVWECDQDGVMTFYGKTGKIEQSEIAAEFPKRM